MYLRELVLGQKVKCTCKSCRGTGIYKGCAELDDLGVICSTCNGNGYTVLNLKKTTALFIDDKMDAVYKVEKGIITERVSLFDGLKRRNDVNYVMYGVGKALSPKKLFAEGASRNEVISYDEFLQGRRPIPMAKYICPLIFTQTYGFGSFDNGCSHCNYDMFDRTGCWDKFYKNAVTVKDRQKSLRRVKHK